MRSAMLQTTQISQFTSSRGCLRMGARILQKESTYECPYFCIESHNVTRKRFQTNVTAKKNQNCGADINVNTGKLNETGCTPTKNDPPIPSPLRNIHLQPEPLQSSSDTTTPHANDTNVNSKDFASQKKLEPFPRAMFPWRHSPYPLPRLIPDTPEYYSQGGYMGPRMPTLNRFIRAIMWTNASGVLGLPLWKIILGRKSVWEDELCYGFSMAFERALSGMLSNVYRVPIHSIYTQMRDEDCNETIHSDNADGKTPGFAVDFSNNIPSPGDSPDTDVKLETDNTLKEDSYPDIEYMLESNLRSLYQAAHEHSTTKLEIKLASQPTSAQITNLFLVPFLTRDQVQSTPAMRHSFRNIWTHLERMERDLDRNLSVSEIVREVGGELEVMGRKQAERNHGIVECTVIAQVSIRCREVFSVRDVELDQIVQGDPDGGVNDVTHLVRFEMVVSIPLEDGGSPQLGTWQITDWDDVLDGNVWFL